MDRALYAVGFTWLLVFGAYEADKHQWDRYAIEVPVLAEKKPFDLIGGWSW